MALGGGSWGSGAETAQSQGSGRRGGSGILSGIVNQVGSMFPNGTYAGPPAATYAPSPAITYASGTGFGGGGGGSWGTPQDPTGKQAIDAAVSGYAGSMGGALAGTGNTYVQPPAYSSAAGPSFQDVYNQLYQQFSDQSAARSGMIDAINSQLQGRIGVYGANYQQQGADAAALYNINARLLQNQANQTGIDLGAAQRQSGLIDQLWTQNRDYMQGQMGRNSNIWDAQSKGYDSTFDYLAKQVTNNNQQRTLTGDRLKQANMMDRFGLISDATGRGAASSFGAQLGLQNLDTQYGNALSQADLQQKQTQQGIDNQYNQTRSAVDVGYNQFQGQQAGLQHQIDNGYQQMLEDKAQNGDKIAALNNQAASYGIQGEKLYQMYVQGIHQLNLDQYMSVDKLLDMMNSNNMDKVAMAEQIARSAAEAASNLAGGMGGGGMGGGGGFANYGSNGAVNWDTTPMSTYRSGANTRVG